MARQNPIPYIPKQPLTVQADRKAAQVAALLGNVGALVQLGAQIETSHQQQENQKQSAYLKIQQLGIEESQRATAAQKQEEARGLQRVEQASRVMQQQFEQASTEIEQNERLGIVHAVNSLRDTQLASANARGLGFTTPAAIIHADQAIGERKANLDFGRLLQAIEMDEGKLPSQHLQEFLKGQSLGSAEATTAYAATLTGRLDACEKSAIIARAKKSRNVIAQNAIDGFQFDISTGFDTLDKEQFGKSLSDLHKWLMAADPTLTEPEFKAQAVGALAPLFVGENARFSAAEGLLKLNELFTPAEAEQFGIGGVVARLKRAAVTAQTNQSEALMKAAKKQIEVAPGHEMVQTVLASLQADDRFSGVQKQELDQLAQARLAEPDYAVDVARRVAGDRSIAMTKAHDNAIMSHYREKEQDANYFRSDSIADAAEKLGRIPDQMVEDINALAASNDPQSTRRAVNQIATLRTQSPALARSMSNQFDKKAFALSVLESLGVTDSQQFIDGFADVTSSDFAQAQTILSDTKNENKQKLSDVMKRDIAGLTRMVAINNRQSGSVVMDASVSQAYEQVLYASMAKMLAQEGPQDGLTLYAKAKSYADQVMVRHVSTVRMDGENYAIAQDDAKRFGFNLVGDKYMKDLSALWDFQRADMEESLGGSMVLDFSRAMPVAKGGLEYISVPVINENNLFGTGDAGTFSFPRANEVRLKAMLDRAEYLHPSDAERSARNAGITTNQFLTGGGAAP